MTAIEFVPEQARAAILQCGRQSLRIAMYHFRPPSAGRKPGGVKVYVDRSASALTRRGREGDSVHVLR
jgi:hypothetical protein